MTAVFRQEVGVYVVVGDDTGFYVIERFGAYRQLKKRFTTARAAVARAEKMNAGAR